MFRTDYGLSDAKHSAITKQLDKEMQEYFEKKVRPIFLDFIAFYIGRGYELDSLWQNSFEAFINGGEDMFNDLSVRNKSEEKIIEQILKEKYSLIMVNKKPLQFKSTKKEPND